MLKPTGNSSSHSMSQLPDTKALSMSCKVQLPLMCQHTEQKPKELPQHLRLVFSTSMPRALRALTRHQTQTSTSGQGYGDALDNPSDSGSQSCPRSTSSSHL